MNILTSLFKKKFTKPKVLNSADRDIVKNRWSNIEQLITAKSPSAAKQAIIEADKLLEFVLKKLVNENQSLGENLKLAKDLFPSWSAYQQAWEAHKIRNALVHESDFEPTHSMSKDTVEKFRLVLQVLGALK